MGEPIPSHPPKKFNTELTDYSVQHAEKTGPYAENLEVDALVVGAGFGKSSASPTAEYNAPYKEHIILCHSQRAH